MKMKQLRWIEIGIGICGGWTAIVWGWTPITVIYSIAADLCIALGVLGLAKEMYKEKGC